MASPIRLPPVPTALESAYKGAALCEHKGDPKKQGRDGCANPVKY